MPDQSSEIYQRIRDVLSQLYSQRADILRVAEDAGIDQRRIPDAGNAIGLWDAVIEEARKIGHLGVVLDVVTSEYGDSLRLRSVVADYWRDKAKRVARETGIPLGTGASVSNTIPANVHMAEALHKVNVRLDQMAQQPHRLRWVALSSIFVVIPAYTALVMGDVREALELTNFMAWVVATGIGYMPPILYIFTLPGWFSSSMVSVMVVALVAGWG